MNIRCFLAKARFHANKINLMSFDLLTDFKRVSYVIFF